MNTEYQQNGKQNQMEKELAELYSKACVAGSIRFVVDEAKEEGVALKEYERFSCNLATILAREKEVVAVRLIPYQNKCVIHLAKNGDWLQKDVDYIDKIENYVKSLSKDAPIKSKEALKRKDVKSLFSDVKKYCSEKFKTRFEKLKNDITDNQNKPYIKSFIDYASTEVESLDKARYKLSGTCSRYYKIAKNSNNSTAPEKFLRHIKKVGSYYVALHDIIACASKEKYKHLFSNMEVHRLSPMTIHQPIHSWKNTVESYIPNPLMYDGFKRRCLSDNDTSARLSVIYGNNLNNESEQHLFLHAEMNILANIIDENPKGIDSTFIAVSKRSCYLCELYIKFAQNKGFEVFTSGAHKKLYRRWMLPNIKDTALRSESIRYMIKSLDRVISGEIAKHVSIVPRSDSEGESGNSDADQNNYEELLSSDESE
jgi:hypothetical protein